MSDGRVQRIKELRERSLFRRRRIDELKCLIQNLKDRGDLMSLEESTHNLACEEQMLQNEQECIQHLELCNYFIPDYLDRLEDHSGTQDAIEESSADEQRSNANKVENDLENSQTWDFVEPPAELEKSTLMIVEEEEPGPGLLSRAVGGVVSLFTWGSAASMSALEATSLGEFSVVHANWYGRRLQRNFRFCEEVFLRINPDTGEIRQVYKYSDVAKVLVKNASFIVISYRDEIYPADWIEASATKIAQILDILSAKLQTLDTPIEKESA